MCKGCEMTRQIELIYQANGIVVDGQFPGPDEFSAAINGPLNILSWIAASFPDRASRRVFVKDTIANFERMTKQRVADVASGVPAAMTRH